MTISERKHQANLKLIGSKNLSEIFKSSKFFCLGVIFVSIMPIWSNKSIEMIFLFSFLVLSVICHLLHNLFSKVMEDTLDELTKIDNLKSWIFNNN